MIFFTQWSNLTLLYLLNNKNTIFYDCILHIHIHVSLVSFWFSWITPKFINIPIVNFIMDEPLINIVDIISHHIPTIIVWNIKRPQFTISKNYSCILYFLYVLFIKKLGYNYPDLYGIDKFLFYFYFIIALYIVDFKNYISTIRPK